LPHSSATDDGFREIQLNGKQLVFLFMAATVVSVVIFLCGVLVGRGVRPVSSGSSPLVASEPARTDVPVLDTPPAPAASATQPVVTEPPPTPDELSYYERLEKDNPPPEKLKTAESRRAAPPAPAGRDANRTPPAASSPPAVSGALSEPAGSGYTVQVAALQARSEAEGIAKRLSTKGYRAYVLSPTAGAPATIYRVRVGKFKTRREAEQVAARLEKEEQFKPWILR